MPGFYDDLIVRAQRYAADADSTADVVLWLYEEIARMLGGERALLPLVNCLYRAFEVEFGAALSVQRWSGFGRGGDFSDEDLERVLGSLQPRTTVIELRQIVPPNG